MHKDVIKKAVSILRNGGLVAMPTETVYGLAADAKNAAAIGKIFRVKNRPFNHPLIVHIAHFSEVYEWAKDVPDNAKKLADVFWPGPLTLILKKAVGVLDSITGGQDTIGLRMPNHPVAKELLKAFGSGLAAPSANQFTQVSPTNSKAVTEELGKNVDLILEGGDCAVGLESTILDISQKGPTILRPGIITAAMIKKVIGKQPLTANDKPLIKTPGQHLIHYAPKTRVLLLPFKQIPLFLQTLNPADLPIALLMHNDINFSLLEKMDFIPMPNNAAHYAHILYRTLRLTDKKNYKMIVLEEVPENEEWSAIRDRLKKASGRG